MSINKHLLPLLKGQIIFTFFILIVINSSHAHVIKFKKLNNENNSTPIQVVEKIQQDTNGFIWIATADSGLFKYNGHRLNPVKITSQSNPIEILSMEIDEHNIVWIGTKKSGLIRYDNGKIKRYSNDKSHTESISSNTVSAVLNDRNGGGLWIGTTNGLNHLSKAGKIQKFILEVESKQTMIRSLMIMGKTLLIATGSGLYGMDLTNNRISKYTLDETNPNLTVYSIHRDFYGRIWLGNWYWVISVGSIQKEI
jgi:ligand-binding sensor domain-containing protein